MSLRGTLKLLWPHRPLEGVGKGPLAQIQGRSQSQCIMSVVLAYCCAVSFVKATGLALSARGGQDQDTQIVVG